MFASILNENNFNRLSALNIYVLAFKPDKRLSGIEGHLPFSIKPNLALKPFFSKNSRTQM
jgi:hypothetical protein